MWVRRFLKDGDGQDLVEYTLMMAFVCLASAGLFVSAGGSVKGVWSQVPVALTGSCAPGVPQDGYNPDGSPYCGTDGRGGGY